MMKTKAKQPNSTGLKRKRTLPSGNAKVAKDFKLHWDNAYDNAPVDKLGWYEAYAEPSLQLIEKSNLQKEASILNVGAGATTLVDELLKKGYKNIIANDLSPNALYKLKARLGIQSNNINWIIDDLTNPKTLNQLGPIDLWHDRAVLHFFTDIADQNTYFNLLKKLVKPKGFVIIAAFNLDGALMCSGLPVNRYDESMLETKLGNEFELTEAFDYNYTMPSGGTRAYIYTLFQRK